MVRKKRKMDKGHMLPTTLWLTAALAVLFVATGWLLSGCGDAGCATAADCPPGQSCIQRLEAGAPPRWICQ